jgi:hypothetical protein
MTERIVAAACRSNILILSLPRPARHGDVMWLASRRAIGPIGPDDQGFLTSEGRFVGRAEAKRIATAAGQIIRESGSPGDPDLYSEDLW